MPSEKIVACGVACLKTTPQGTEILFLRKQSEGQEWLLLPGGKRKKGEASSACARRELEEETGIQILVDRLVHLGSFVGPGLPKDGKVEFHLYLLRQQPDWSRISVKLSHEHLDYLWLMAGAALDRTDLLPLVREVIKLLQRKKVV